MVRSTNHTSVTGSPSYGPRLTAAAVRSETRSAGEKISPYATLTRRYGPLTASSRILNATWELGRVRVLQRSLRRPRPDLDLARQCGFEVGVPFA